MPEQVTDHDAKAWVDDFLTTLQDIGRQGGVVTWVDHETNNKVAVMLTQEFIDTIKANRSALLAVGKEDFKGFLLLLQAGENYEALRQIYSKMSNEDLVQQAAQDTEKLARLAEDAENQRQFWLNLAEQAGIKILSGAIGMLLP